MQVRKVVWEGADLKKLLTFTKEQLQKEYPWIGWETLRRTRNKYRQKARQVAQMEQEPKPNSHMDKLSELFKRSGIDPNDIQQINRVNIYQGYMKNPDGEFETIDLVSAQYVPKPEETDGSEFLSQADPVIIKPTRGKGKRSRDKTVVVLPDIQAGFRKYDDNPDLDPIHDDKAISVAMQIINDIKPDKIILNGDNTDFPNFGRFAQENSFFETTNATLNYVHQLLAQMRATSPESEIIYIAGNHEERLRKTLMTHVPQIREIRVAGTGERPMTVPFLLNLAALDVEYISGYPAGAHWLTDDLKVIHGDIAKQSGGMTASAYLKREDTSTIYGHIHRQEIAYRSIGSRHAGRFVVAASFGCLARIDGAVPSYHSGVDEDGYPMRYVEDWQQGLGVVHISKLGRFAIDPIYINTFNDYETRYQGKLYVPEV